MRGGAQSHLVEADDSRYYVVKFVNNPQHRRILVNELLGSCILQYLQISTPETAIISVDRDFLLDNPQVSFELGTKRVPVEVGWHFGSRYPADPSTIAVYDFFPDVLLEKIINLSDFLGVLVVDKWMANADARQSIYFRAQVRNPFSPRQQERRQTGFIAQMIDQGYLFNGPFWNFPDAPLHGLALRRKVYETVTSLNDFQPWLDQVLNIPPEVLDDARKRIPSQWLDQDSGALDSLLEKLFERRSLTPDLILSCRRTKPDLFPNWL